MRIEEVWPEWHEIEILGEGSFGKVYKAQREEFGNIFYSAIKVLSVPKSQQDIDQERKQGLSDFEIHQYFESVVLDVTNEIVLMDSLKGARNIVNIDDYKIIEHSDGIGWDIFIRMELLTPFEEFMRIKSDFSYADVLNMGIDICSALEMCEYNGIVHRDIKPDNVFVSKYGEYKLGDFGISRQLDKTQANMSRKGTLNFMAPEVYKGEPYGSSVDTYSLGLVLYKILNGNRLPFISSNAENLSFNERQEAFEKRIRGETLPYIEGISQTLNYILQKACAYDPANRYRSAAEFKNDLMLEMNGAYGIGYSSSTVSNVYGQDGNNSSERTTNDMTSNGTVVGGTGESYQETDNVYGMSGTTSKDYTTIPWTGSIAKTSKLCRYLAIPFALATIITYLVTANYITFFSAAAVALLAALFSHNKAAMGVSVAAYAADILLYFFTVENGNYDSPIYYIIIVIAYSLVLLGGFTMLFRKEVRLSGMLCLYGLALRLIPDIIYGFDAPYANLLLTAFVCITVLLWSYGYDSQRNLKTADRTVHNLSYVLLIVVCLALIKLILTIIF
ncbi:MAG: serine/threonine protein kinase [Clostridiales bacterium]|nr:serine/threonine protein kinase [Clostridiales bacterium]